MDESGIRPLKRRFTALPTTALSLGLRLHSVGEGFWHHRRRREFGAVQTRRLHLAVLLTGGGGWFEVPGAPRRAVRPGQLCWIPAGRAAGYRPRRDGWWIERWITCDGPSPEHWVATGILPAEPCQVDGAGCEAALALALDRCRDEAYPEAALAAFGVLHALAAAIAAPPPRRHPIHDQVARIRADPARDWELDALAAEAGLGRDGLRKAFLRLCGRPPVVFIAERRLDLARQYLLDGASVAEAARASGFADPGYFSRRFRRAYGIPPSRLAAGESA